MFEKGIFAALLSAFLFGAGTPLAKLFLDDVSPWMLAGLLYLGSGIGLAIYRLSMRLPRVRLPAREWLWFSGAILAGGVIAPVMLMKGLASMPASGVSLLLNMEGVFTALLAWFVFKENFDRRIALGMGLIVLGALILSWPTKISFSGMLPSVAVIGACLAWGLDNNLTRKVSLVDGTWVTCIKGLVAGLVNLCLAIGMGNSFPSAVPIAEVMVIGFFAYGVSLTLFVVGLRNLGTARTGAYFSVAPFFGAILAMIMGEPITSGLMIAGLFMGAGIWLHISEQHEHEHAHEYLEHEHEHDHDEHHQHLHDLGSTIGLNHVHKHTHKPIVHSHKHFPDSHHQHKHN